MKQVTATYADGKVTLKAPANVSYNGCEFKDRGAFRYQVKADGEWETFMIGDEVDGFTSWYVNDQIERAYRSSCDTGPDFEPVNGLVLNLPEKILRRSGEKALAAKDVDKANSSNGLDATDYKEGDSLPHLVDTAYLRAKVVLRLYPLPNESRNYEEFTFEFQE